MHIDCLKYFDQVASIGSISKVANQSHVLELSKKVQSENTQNKLF